MKPTSKEFLEEVSKHCSNQITFYTFNKTTLQVSNKYREGRLASLKYVGELTFYYLQEERNIKHKFKIRGQVIMITHFLLLFTTPYTAGCDIPNTLAIICCE